MNRRPRPGARARLRAVGALVCALACVGGTAGGEIAFQSREDVDVGSGPSAVTLLPTTPPIALIADSKGLTAFRFEDGIFAPGARSIEGRSAQILVSGPLAPGGGTAIAYASREGARIAVAPVDAHGNVGAAELIDLPTLPRAARIAAVNAGGPAALFVAHDDGLSLLTRGASGWQRRDLAAPQFARD